MNAMLRAYKARWGEAAMLHGENGSNGPCPFCGDTSSGWHRSDRFVIWADRSEGVGEECAKAGVAGVYWCRQCGASGDSVSYFMKAEGMNFRDACDACGIILPDSPKDRIKRHRSAPAEPAARPFEGRPASDPGDAWRLQAEKLDAEARASLPKSASALRWLREKHGISQAMAEHYGLGVLTGENGRDVRFRARSAFGLPEIAGKDGRIVRSLCIRRGVTIVSRDGSGRIAMFRVRRPAGDVERDGKAKYWELPGGTRTAFVLRPDGRPPVSAWIIVEGELDAILLHAVAGGGIGTMATRSASNHPDAEAHELLSAADIILVCLDADEAGRRGAEWWLTTYRQAVDATVPQGKDPGDAMEAGLDLRAWLRSVLPASVAMPPVIGISTGEAQEAVPAPHASTSTADHASIVPDAPGDDPQPERAGDLPADFPFSTESSAAPEALRFREGNGGNDAGDGGMDVMPASDSVSLPAETPVRFSGYATIFPPAVMAGLRKAAPSYLVFDAIPADVLRLAVLWRWAPVRYHKFADGGFEWDAPLSWRREHADEWGKILRLATTSPDIGDWLSSHVSRDIWSGNFLEVFGGGE